MKTHSFTIAKAALLTLIAAVFFVTNQPLFMIGSDTASELISPRLSIQVVALALIALALWLRVPLPARTVLFAVAFLAVLLGGHRLVIDNMHHRLKDVYLGISVQKLTLDPSSEAGLAARWVPLGFFIGPRDSPNTLFIFSPIAIGLDHADVVRWTT
jgi:hypothetical protein